jgi:lipooligosaccharide transport system ATP-binding protein
MNNIIRAQKLVKRYKDLVAVDGIDFEIAEGETFGFLGPNGAGKTTTMKMI